MRRRTAAGLVLFLPGQAFGEGLLDPAGPVASAQAAHFTFVTAIMLLVILPLFVALPIVLWRYRRGGTGLFRPDWEYNRLLEILVWGVPVLIVMVLAVKLWHSTHNLDPYRPLGPDPYQVQVVSLDWKFLFLYPEHGVATRDLLVLPENRPVSLDLTSGTVMQAFTVPRLAGQIYTMAGMRTALNFATDAAGTFIGRNTQYNGNGFAAQSFETRVMSAEDHAAWLDQARAQGVALDWATYEQLQSEQSLTDPTLYSGFDAGLFERVIAQFAPDMVQGMAMEHGQ